MPVEIESALSTVVSVDAAFDWDAEYVTKLPGKGEGRNHDAVLYNEDIDAFLEATNAYEENGLKVIPNKTNIKLYFKKIVI